MTALAQAYTKIRRQYGANARTSIYWARQELRRAELGIEWSTDYSTYLPVGTGSIDGFDIEVECGYETDPMPRGEFYDSYRPGAIQNPGYRPNAYGSDSRLQWYVPESGTLQVHRKELRAIGMSKHTAYATAMRILREEALSGATPNQYTITVTATRNDVELASTVIGCYEVSEDTYFEDLVGAASDIVEEVLETAKSKLSALRS